MKPFSPSHKISSMEARDGRSEHGGDAMRHGGAIGRLTTLLGSLTLGAFLSLFTIGQTPPSVPSNLQFGVSNSAPAGCSDPATYDADDFDNVIEDFTSTETLSLVGHEWDNTLVRNCRIHDTGGDGVYLRDVRNVVIQGCEIWNVGSANAHRGVKVSAYGSSQDVVIDNNYLHDIPQSGIYSADEPSKNTDQKGLEILNNRIERVGTDTTYHGHAIYIQSADVLVEGNVISGSRGGNGISMRSSGVVRCNSVSGTSRTDRPAIRYYSDHDAGVSNLLLIENNTIVDDNRGIHLNKPVTSKSGLSPPENVVKTFIIRFNAIDAPVEIDVDSAYDDPGFSVTVEDNTSL